MRPEQFNEIRALFGTMDDLCQERRGAYTGWVGGKVEPEAFIGAMRENLRRTRETMDELEKRLFPGS